MNLRHYGLTFIKKLFVYMIILLNLSKIDNFIVYEFCSVLENIFGKRMNKILMSKKVWLIVLVFSLSFFLINGISTRINYLETVDIVKSSLADIAENQKKVIEELHSHQMTKDSILRFYIQSFRLSNIQVSKRSFVIAELVGDTIQILFKEKLNGEQCPDKNAHIRKSDFPMNLALKGKTGIIEGLDCNKTKVLAAYTYVDSLKWGIVAKIDSSEISNPFIKRFFITLGVSLLLIIIGTFFLIRIIRQLITTILESEAKYKNLHEHSGVGVGFYKPDGTIISYNILAATHLNGKPEDFIGKSIYDIFPKPEADVYNNRLLEAIKSPDKMVYQDLISLPIGNKYFISTYTKIFDSKNNILGIQIISQDLSARKQAEDALKESEEKYKNLVETASDAIYLMSEEGTIIDTNQSACDMLAKSKHEIIGSLIDSVDPNFPIDEFLMFWKDVPFNQQYIFETTHLHKNGDLIPVEISAKKYILDDRTYYYGIARDITNRKKAEDTLKESEKYHKAIIHTTADGFWILNKTGKFLDVNEAYCKMSGYTEEEILSMSINDVDEIEDVEMTKSRIRRIIENGSEIFPTIHRRKDGSTFPVEVSASWFDSANGRFICFCRDISERKQFEYALKESEAKNRATLEAIPDLMLIFDKNGVYLDYHAPDESLLAVTPDEFLGKSIKDVFDEPISSLMINSLDNTFKTKEIQILNYSLDLPIGTHHFESRIVLIDDDRVLTIIRDISEHKKAEETLSETISLLKATLESTADGILVVDIQGRIIDYNSKFLKIWGMPESLIPEGKTKDLVAPENVDMAMNHIIKQLSDPQLFISKVQELYNNPEEESFDILNFKDGRIIERFSKPQYLNDVPVGRVWSFRDVTDRKKAEDELIIAKDKAEESDKLKTAFLQNISHEIRTPLNGVIGFANLLQDEGVSKEEICEYTTIINQSGNRLLEIINNVLDISKIETGQLVANNTYFPLNSLIAEIYSMFSINAKEKHLELNYKFPDDTDKLNIRSDKFRLNQILINLVSNAIKFTNSGSIDFGYKIIGEKIEFFVKDTGIGINKDLQSEIFKRFTQANSNTSSEYDGAGLGLAICKGLVELLGGKIWIESETNHGTTFFFTIPYIFDNQFETHETTVSIEKRNITNKTILIAEDDLTSFYFLSKILNRADLNIIHAKNGKEAVEFVRNRPEISLVLMDMKMPVMDGLEAIKEIISIRPDIPIIAQSAYAFTEEKETALEAGCIDYLTKPIEQDILLNMINKYF